MILDEFALAEAILKKNLIDKKEDIFVAAKYLRQEMKCDVLETYCILNSIMENSFSNFKSFEAAPYLENLAVKAINYELKKIDYITVTHNELKTISNIDSPKDKRLLFSLLVHAKYNNLLFESNNDWCNISIQDLYKTARVSTRNSKEKALHLCKLNTQGYIDFSKKNVNHNIRCLIIDKESTDKALIISDIRELGYQYLNIFDKNHFCRCEKCGKIIKKINKNDFSTKYCNVCKQTIKNEQNLNYFQKLDKAHHQ